MPLLTSICLFVNAIIICISRTKLRDILKGLGKNPTDEELFELISLVDTNMSGTIDFAEFLAVINFQKENAAKDDGAREIVFAFTACGGNSDKSGYVKTDRVVHVVKEIFKLHFDIKSLMDSLDEEEEGQVRGSSINITPSFYSFSLFLFINTSPSFNLCNHYQQIDFEKFRSIFA